MTETNLSVRRLGYCRRSAPAWASVPRREIIVGDALATLRTLPANSVDTVVTSPAYYLLRDYQVEGQLGMEASVYEWVEHLVAVCDDLARVLRPTGSMWLNLGDSFSRHRRFGTPPKSLLLGPERLLLALSQRGWIVRNKVVWAKPNPMPASVTDRLNTTWEPVFLLVRSPHYYFHLDAIREPHRSWRPPTKRPNTGLKYAAAKRPPWSGPLAGSSSGLVKIRAEGRVGHPLGRNPGDVWTVATAKFGGKHYATFPAGLIDRPIRATCPEKVCNACGRAWSHVDGSLHPDCRCKAGSRPGLVLDPFIGAGTTALVAERLGRDWLGIEINPDYARLAMERIKDERSKRRSA
jgi:DNA modification methylase